ncbi:hypothetical protein COT42_08945 [Candidatus Saganbacteria bacterium CG08_land_8_20_14_0_20_45_16]|uniref:CARDB domain-containing protein n=1 Tax=Candidatus Saganbacteria bacterium CG08_land_8_20_14_0_20_45_16 TaxID=2014293 RepID=A0A2H0XVD5_UNCSA|nr:MAG: hypothetical protein COT42_08945 [Candidatus Saganbacteria bacterium CG08_land_8_20_14_0_20_45_16]
MKKLLIFGLVLFCFSKVALASYITLQTSVTTKIEASSLKVLVAVENKGDESAYNVQAEIRALGTKVLAKRASEVAINGRYEAYEELNLDLAKPGEYPLVVVMHYADANQYPFSALTCQTFNYRAQSVPAELFGKLTSDKFWDKGRVFLTLKNLSESDLTLKVLLVGPQELNFPGDKTLALAGKGTAKVNFEVGNFSALSGSTYQIFALAEYDQAGRHQTIITQGTVRLVQESVFLGLKYSYLVALLIGLVLVFIFVQFGLPLLNKK